MASQVRRRRASRAPLASLLVVAAVAAGGCVGRHALAARDTAGVAPPLAAPAIAWFSPDHAPDLRTLEHWRSSVGPPVFVPAAAATPRPADRLAVVSWNTALGAGDVERLVRDVRTRTPGAHLVLLLQEVYRGGDEVPAVLGRAAAFAARLRGTRADGGRDEIEAIASALGMGVYYVPSMRNGGLHSDEDRGNAILSTLPLTGLTAFELPFERQRRVAVGAELSGTTGDGRPWRLRVVSAHLDNLAGLRRLWIGSELGRVRQTRGLVAQLAGEDPLVLGGDFNTWFGFSDQAYRETARAFPDTRVTDRRATFHGVLRLDHLFYRLPDGWRTEVARADDDYGSDHYPLVATIDLR